MMGSKKHYAPPACPPPKKPLLKASTAMYYPVDLEQLASDGWTTLPTSDGPSDPLYTAFSELFEASALFFNLPEDERMRYRVASKADSQVSEEGYSRVEGEKCMIALRKARTTPTEFGLRDKAETAWRASAKVMHDVLAAIEESLGMNGGALLRATEAQVTLPQAGDENVATLMRMFRYDRPTSEAEMKQESRVVSEPHKDLGLLTIVVGHSPGLECLDSQRSEWVSCETKEGLNATILVGQTLAQFTNGRYSAGRHRVFVDPVSNPTHTGPTPAPNPTSALSDQSYRFSLVHALRGHLPLRVSYSDFETPITGPFPPPMRFVDTSILDIYWAISKAHWNVNISVEERRRQEKLLLERAKSETMKSHSVYGPGSISGRFSKLLSVFRRNSRQPTSVS